MYKRQGSGDLYGLWLMTMATYDLEAYLDAVKLVKANLGGPTNVYSNVGDTSSEGFEAMKAAGIDGVYHCWRLREGVDTCLLYTSLPHRRCPRP